MNVRAFLQQLEPERKALAKKVTLWGAALFIILVGLVYLDLNFQFLGLLFYPGMALALLGFWVWKKIVDSTQYGKSFKSRVVPGVVGTIVSDLIYQRYIHPEKSKDVFLEVKYSIQEVLTYVIF